MSTSLPVLFVPDLVLLPGMVVPLALDESSQAAIDAAGENGDRVYFRSLATRGAHEVPEHLTDVIDTLKAEVPIWKHQHLGDGDTEWVGLP